VDCEQIRENIDAYALGAASADEATAVEEHAGSCIGCWNELKKARQAAAMLPLASAIEQPPAHLGERIMSAAAREEKPRRAPLSIFSGGKGAWPAAASGFGMAAAAAVVFAIFMQAQVDDLQHDRTQLQSEVSEQGGIIRVAAASDVQTVSLVSMADEPATQGAAPGGEYLWSRSQGKGVIFCYNLPALHEDEVYQAWYATETEPISAGTFEPEDGGCEHLMEPVIADISATGVGLSREKSPGSPRPSGRWLIFAVFGD
jgi:hypothetical protein